MGLLIASTQVMASRGRSRGWWTRWEWPGKRRTQGMLASHVTHELVLLNKGTATLSTSIRALASVDPFMLNAMVFTLKAPPTIHALVWPERLLVQGGHVVVEGRHQPLEQSRGELLSIVTTRRLYPLPPKHCQVNNKYGASLECSIWPNLSHSYGQVQLLCCITGMLYCGPLMLS